MTGPKVVLLAKATPTHIRPETADHCHDAPRAGRDRYQAQLAATPASWPRSGTKVGNLRAELHQTQKLAGIRLRLAKGAPCGQGPGTVSA